MTVFRKQNRYKNIVSDDASYQTIYSYARDFLDWFHDELKDAPVMDRSEWMTAYSALPYARFRRSVIKGVGGYLRARGSFPDFRKARDHTQMTLMNSLLLPMPRNNPADKLAVGAHIPDDLKDSVQTARAVRVFETSDDITFEGLPKGAYFVKSNHGSAHILHVDTRTADPDMDEIKAKAAQWLAADYGSNSSQWWYSLIERRIFIEEDLRATPDMVLPDLKFHMINGQVGLLQHSSGTLTEERDDAIYDGELNYMPDNFLRQNRIEVQLPALAEKARDVALRLAAPHKFVRVDLYLRDEDIILGELTFLPNAGRRKIRSKRLNQMLVKKWEKMPRVVGIANVGE